MAVPTAFWKVVVDPDNGEALTFVMPQRDIPKGKLAPWQTSIEDVERLTRTVTAADAPETSTRAKCPRVTVNSRSVLFGAFL